MTEVHSHPQALNQCREFLAANFWAAPLSERMIQHDTAESARRLKAGELPKRRLLLLIKPVQKYTTATFKRKYSRSQKQLDPLL
ncbi:prephenate dehydratase domain-containing protein [Coxiella endosymbiont of Ornithodoros maritimus]|uniref:prephenate dehydratase domain-containing protein n=1 Tax=Coxiella endosymbiont of Ornithodoros maritimus TaxID=1656172 RepID=UPI002263D616|nr:prephenate dehydratase domain-containing protein [Coxiella endosymbiont of Ornithodoros maritimus]